MESFLKSVVLPVGQQAAFDYHARPGALQRLLPPWQNVSVAKPGGIKDGDIVVLKLKLGPLSKKWVARHQDYRPPYSFSDVQQSGPFQKWHHTHRFVALDDNSCRLEDDIEYEVPLGRLGGVLGGGHIRHQLDRMFRFRHVTTAADLRLHRYAQERLSTATETQGSDSQQAVAADGVKLKIAVSGSTGLVGSALCALLSTGGHDVYRLVRTDHPNREKNEIGWKPATGLVDPQSLSGFDAVVHLAGKSIADKRWNAQVKEELRSSRVEPTRILCDQISSCTTPPKTFICASASGYYGDRGDEILDENSRPGTTFLANVAQQWEQACDVAKERGIRVVHARLGIVLDPREGALSKLLPVFRLGLGGRVGSGQQYWSWIAVDDAVGAMYYLIVRPDIHGPVNLSAPHSPTNSAFTKTLGQILRRPHFLPAPASAMRIGLGEMADALLLSSARMAPTVLNESGYPFRCPSLESALRLQLGLLPDQHPELDG